MKVQQCRDTKGRFEASGTINELNLELLDGTRFHVGFMAWGDSMSEAVANCLRKMDQHLYPEQYERCLTCGKIQCLCYEEYKDNQ